MLYCSRCGTPSDEGTRFCRNCGAALNPAIVQAAPAWQPPSPAATPVIPVMPVAYVLPRKSVGAAVALAFLFGPFGMLYATVPGALIMLAISFVLAIATAGISVFLTWPVCIIWAALAAQAYNEGKR